MFKINKVFINEFRVFKEKEIQLGDIVTVISGMNGTGKSNLLGILGNACEYSILGRIASKWIQKTYRTKFSEIFKASPDYDKPCKKNYTIYFSDGEDVFFRTSWLKGGRFRLIPSRASRSSSKKKGIPVIYVGLSRLYPMGEYKEFKATNMFSGITDDDNKKWLFDKIKETLHMWEDVTGASDIKDDASHQCFGIDTSDYDYLGNSAGQNNIARILIALLKFRKLKQHLGEDFPGGLLLIDEFDATLHPAAQIRLFDLIFRESKAIGIQTVFTTHSLTLLENICPKVGHEGNNDISLVYITTANGQLGVWQNPSYEETYHDITATVNNINITKIKIYAEDDEARWFIRAMLENEGIMNRVYIIENINLGCKEMLSLRENDPIYFKNILIILDGDARADGRKNKHPNVIYLPSEFAPEKLIIEFLKKETPESSDFLDLKAVKSIGLSRRTLEDFDPTNNGTKKEREGYKDWFNGMKHLFDECCLVLKWIDGNRLDYSTFISDFKRAYNDIAHREHLPKI